MISSQAEPHKEMSEKQVAYLLSKTSVNLSFILSCLRDLAASDEQLSQIYSELEEVSAQLSKLAERRFPAPANVAALVPPVSALRQMGANLRHQFTYCSPKMHALLDRIERAARRDVPILITGETGVGKELIARFIHISSPRKSHPLVPVNCAAIPRELFEDQFFGHKQGAFTGALRDNAGAIRSASGGTLFLDEIGELPLELQPKLLRFLQEGEVHPVGGNQPTRVDVRVIASTNRDLEEEVKAGRFRADLLHRLNVISFEIPPLRERREDIPLLLNFFLDKYSGLPGNHKINFAPDSMGYLTNYSWPGNVRELKNLVLQLVCLAEEDAVIFTSDLPDKITGLASAFTEEAERAANAGPEDMSALSLGEAINLLERQRVYDALFKNDWNYSRAARQLGLSTYGLRKKYRRLFGSEAAADVAES